MAKPKNQDYKYKFSFVIPVYNVENYLAETVESILAQTMDFERNCEIIFVNDGSPDNSEEVCLRYREQFPNNITYIKQKNAGPGAARNRGITEAQGKYISLLDSDDKLSRNTLDEVYKFFEKHYDEIDLVGIKQHFFDAQEGDHPMSYKFTSDRVVDLREDFTQVHMPVNASFFKTEVVREHRSDPKVGRYAEDARLVAEILMDKCRYGMVSEPIYFYRKRPDLASSLDTSKIDKFWYLETPKRAWYDLFDYARRHNSGDIPKFIQFIVMYDLQWRFQQAQQAVLTKAEVAQYKALVYGLLACIDDDVVMAQRYMGNPHKLFVLGKKHHDSIELYAEEKGGKYFYRGQEIYDPMKAGASAHIEFLELRSGKLSIEGYFDGTLFGDSLLQFQIGSEQYEVEPVSRAQKREEFLGDLVSSMNCFRVVVPARPETSISVHVSGESRKLPLIVHRFSGLGQSTGSAYRVCGDLIIRKTTGKLSLYNRTYLRRIGFEWIHWVVLAKRVKLRIFKKQYHNWRQLRRSGEPLNMRDLRWVLVPAKSMARNVYVILFRIAYYTAKPFYRRPVWLLSHRIMETDDSGEILFRYLSKRKIDANVFFAIGRKSGDYARLKHYGKVVDYHSLRYKLLFLLAAKVISSEATDYIINAFGGRMEDLVDLYNFDFVFLQHGIIRDDISGWLNRYDKNIKLFITSTRSEYESVVNGNYGYDETIVKLTGLPRYDFLKSDPRNKIIVAPTWRQDLAGRVDPKTGQCLYNPNFKRSDYFKFYRDLISDKRIQSAMQKYGFKGEFYLHPSFRHQARDSTGNEYFKMQMPYDYSKAKREGSLLVTDYSSVAFDFAYLKKPIIYTHFDEANFYKVHISKEGYFVYEEDGFGLVVYNYKDTVKEIIKAIETGRGMPKKYQVRVEKFFAYNDRNNSNRVYEAIVEMDARKELKINA